VAAGLHFLGQAGFFSTVTRDGLTSSELLSKHIHAFALPLGIGFGLTIPLWRQVYLSATLRGGVQPMLAAIVVDGQDRSSGLALQPWFSADLRFRAALSSRVSVFVGSDLSMAIDPLRPVWTLTPHLGILISFRATAKTSSGGADALTP